MEPDRALLLVDAHTRGRASVRAALLEWIDKWMLGLSASAFYAADVRQVVAQVRIAQEAVAVQTWAYLDALGTYAPGRPDVQDLRGTDADLVWDRPLREYRYQVNLGRDHQGALDRARLRAKAVAEEDLRLAMRSASAQHSKAAEGVIGQRRVLHPEMSAGGSCGLCIAASDRIYRPGTLLPIHDGCNCGVAEVTAESDPGGALNGVSLGDLYEAAGGTDAAALKRTRYRVEDHGELGPVLVPAGARFRSRSQVQRDTGKRMDAKDKATKQLSVAQDAARDLRRRGTAGEDVELQLAALDRRIKQLLAMSA